MIAEYTEDGRIYHLMYGPVSPEVIPIFEATGRPFVYQPVPDPHLYTNLNAYVDVATETILFRPELDCETTYNIAADDIDAVTIPIPISPATVIINGEETVTTDPNIVFTADEPGVYELNIEIFPYLPKTVIVNAT